MTPRRNLIEAELKGNIDYRELAVLESQLEAWEQELIDMVQEKITEYNRVVSECDVQIELHRRVDEALVKVLQDARDEKLNRLASQQLRIERKLFDVSRRLLAKKEPESSDLTRLYRRAIEAHRHRVLMPTVWDEMLWAALDGKWGFGE